MSKNSKLRLQHLAEESVILSALSRFSKWIYCLLGSGLFGRVFSSYSVENDLFDKRAFASVLRDANRADAAKQSKRTFSRAVERSRILCIPARVHEAVLTAPLNAHGMFWLLFGTISLLCYYLQINFSGTAETANAIVGGCAFILSIPMLAVNAPLKKVMQGSVFFTWIARPLGIRFSSDDEESNVNYYLTAVILSMIAGAATYWISTPLFLAAVIIINLAVTLINRPEWGVCLSAAILPWIWIFQFDVTLLFIPTGLSLVGFLGKWVQGRRAFRWELMDAAVGMLTGLCLVYAVISAKTAGALQAGMRVVLALSLYYMIVNLMRVHEWLLRLKRVLLFSSALSGVYDFIISFVENAENSMKPADGDWISGVAVCFIIMFLLTLAEWMNASSFGWKLYYCSIGLALLLGLCTSGNIITLQLLLFSVSLYFLFFNAKTLETLIVLSCPISAIVIWLRALVYDDNVGQWDGLKIKLTAQHALMADLADYRAGVRTGVLSMLRHYWVCGIGIGQSSFASTYPQFAEQGMAGALTAHNTYLQIAAELGLPGSIILTAVVLLFLQVMFGYLKAFPAGQSRLDTMACVSGLAVLMIAGFGTSVFTDVSIILFTVLVMGYAVAAADSDARERRAVMSVFNTGNRNVDIVFSSFV